MGRYTVVWRPPAEEQLAAIWLDADDREAARLAVVEADRWLSRSPADLGESRAGAERVAFVGPLVLCFEVIEADRVVRVLGVKKLSSRRG